MRTNQYIIHLPRTNIFKHLFLSWIGCKILRHKNSLYNLNNMFTYSDKYGNGWCCPFCNWEYLDMASYRLKNEGEQNDV